MLQTRPATRQREALGGGGPPQRPSWSCASGLRNRGFRCQNLLPVGSLMLKNARQRLGGPIRQEPHWPPGPSPSVGSRRHSGPSGEWVRNLFTSILRYMRPFFFLFTIIVTLVNPSITDKSDYNVTGCRRGRKGDIYVYVQLLQKDRQHCFSWDGGRTISEGHVSLWGVWRAG